MEAKAPAAVLWDCRPYKYIDFSETAIWWAFFPLEKWKQIATKVKGEKVVVTYKISITLKKGLITFHIFQVQFNF